MRTVTIRIGWLYSWIFGVIFLFFPNADLQASTIYMTIVDCAGNITSGDVAQSWLGDGYCDDGTYGPNFNCAAYNYDNGDCAGGGVQATATDCVGNTTSLAQIQAWLGDGYCDDGTYGLVLNCPQYNYDYGDCGVATGGGVQATAMDCVGNITSLAQIQAWLGDGYCDDGTYGLVLNCPQYNYDYGDCYSGGGGALSVYPGNSCGVDGVYDCNNRCVSVGDVIGMMSNGWCESGLVNVNLDCPQFNYEGGDCDYVL